MSKISFESALDKLEKILFDMESGNLTLDESIKAYEEAVNIISHSRAELECCRRKIEVLRQEKGIVAVNEIKDEFQ